MSDISTFSSVVECFTVAYYSTVQLTFEDVAKYGSVYGDDEDSCALCNIKVINYCLAM